MKKRDSLIKGACHRHPSLRRQADDLASKRSLLYGFLATCYQQEISFPFLRQLREKDLCHSLAEMGMNWDNSLPMKEEALVEALAVEYCRLFIAPGGDFLPPYESVHLSEGNGKLWGEATVAVKKFYERCGLHLSPQCTYISDHLGLELEFMRFLTQEESLALQKRKKETALQYLTWQEGFLREHLLSWAPVFCDKVMALPTKTGFYPAIARLTKEFILYDYKQVKALLEAD